MFANAPRKLVVLLAALVAGRLLLGLLFGSFAYALLWSFLLGVLSIRSLLGVQLAGKILAYLCYALVVLGVLATLLSVAQSNITEPLLSGAWCVLAIATARALLSSAEAKSFFESFDSKAAQQPEA
jgi:hypothetical protein